MLPRSPSLRRLRTLGATALCVSLASGAVFARGYSSVEVRGAEFISGADIQTACEIAPGVAYSAADLADMEDCLMSSGQFRSVSVRPDASTLVVEVKELNDRPGRIDFGVLYDSKDRLTASLRMERYNLFPGAYGEVELKLSRESRSIGSYLYVKEAFGPLDFGLEIGVQDSAYGDAGFRHRRALIEPYLAYKVSDALRLEFGAGYRLDRMSGLAATAGPLLRSETGSIKAPFLRLGLHYDAPSGPGGVGLAAAVDYYSWGIGSTRRTSELRLGGDVSVPLGDSTRLLLGARGGLVEAHGGARTRTVDRFLIGGADFRGFAPRGIGPKEGGHFVGATRFVVGSVELQRDIGEVLGSPARLGIFADVGSAWGLDRPVAGIDASRKMRSAVGVSVTFDVGSVPVSAYIAKPLRHDARDERQSFGISFNRAF